MEYSTKEVLTWAFTHPDIKPAIDNYLYLCHSKIGEPTKSDNSEFNKAVAILQQIAEIGNPNVCTGMFANAGNLFMKARQIQTDEKKLLSYVGQMFCNHWTRQGFLNLQLQQEISTLEYKGSFWERHGDKLITIGTTAIGGLGMFFGASPAQAVGCSARGANDLLDSHSDEFNASKRIFDEFRNAILSLRF